MNFTESKQLISRALQALSGHCDGAQQQDNIGFNGTDSRWGKQMAPTDPGTWSPRCAWLLCKMIRKYQKQLSAYGVDISPLAEIDGQGAVELLANQERMTSGYSRPATPEPKPEPPANRIVRAVKHVYEIHFGYNAAIVETVKALPYKCREFVNAVPKHWIVSVVPGLENLKAILSFFEAIEKFNFELDSATRAEIMAIKDELEAGERQRAENMTTSRAVDADIDIPGFRLELRPYQRGGVHYGSKNKRVLIADDMGLGKTPQSLAIVQLHGAYPCLVVCRGSLRENWMREIAKALPHRTFSTSPFASTDFVIVSHYDLVKAQEDLAAKKWGAIIGDECFQYDTLVLTEDGHEKIGDLVNRKSFKKVLSFNKFTGDLEWKRIYGHIRIPRTQRIVRIKHEFGILECTENHPVFVGKVFKNAGQILRGEKLFVLCGTLPCNEAGKKNSDNLQPIMRGIFEAQKNEPCNCVGENAKDAVRSLQNYEGEAQSEDVEIHVGKKSGAGIQEKTGSNFQSKKGQVFPWEAWRKWILNLASNFIVSSFKGIRRGVGVCDKNSGAREGEDTGTAQVPSSCLQGGYCNSSSNACDRSGRDDAPEPEMEVAGCEKNQHIKLSRVESVEVLEQGSFGEQKPLCDEVFCLKVEGNRNFFAGGVLVSNCQDFKGYKAQRTKALKAIAKKANVEYRIMLSGTPLENRPQELMSQLDILGQLEEFGGFQKFAYRYCGAHRDRFGLQIGGATNLEELNQKLRSICMIRRLKADVLSELPAKDRQVITVDISNRKEYNTVHEGVRRDIIKLKASATERTAQVLKDVAEYDIDSLIEFVCEVWPSTTKKVCMEWRKMEEQEARENLLKHIESGFKNKAAAVESAMTIMLLNRLKDAAARGKLEAFKEWAQDFVDGGKKLVIFAYSTAVQKAAMEAIPGAIWSRSGQFKTTQAAIDHFAERKDIPAIVLSLKGDNAGLNGLQSVSSHVAFIDEGWVFKMHEQAEDRLHRIGQTDSVTAFYFLANNTVDQQIWDLLMEKDRIAKAAIDGEAVGEQVSIIKEISNALVQGRLAITSGNLDEADRQMEVIAENMERANELGMQLP